MHVGAILGPFTSTYQNWYRQAIYFDLKVDEFCVLFKNEILERAQGSALCCFEPVWSSARGIQTVGILLYGTYQLSTVDKLDRTSVPDLPRASQNLSKLSKNHLEKNLKFRQFLG